MHKPEDGVFMRKIFFTPCGIFLVASLKISTERKNHQVLHAVPKIKIGKIKNVILNFIGFPNKIFLGVSKLLPGLLTSTGTYIFFWKIMISREKCMALGGSM
jgi:hypothetical protein